MLEAVRSPGTGITDDCEFLLGCWELNPSTLQEQEMCLAAEPSFWPHILNVLYLAGFAYFQLEPLEPPKLPF